MILPSDCAGSAGYLRHASARLVAGAGFVPRSESEWDRCAQHDHDLAFEFLVWSRYGGDRGCAPCRKQDRHECNKPDASSLQGLVPRVPGAGCAKRTQGMFLRVTSAFAWLSAGKSSV